MNQLKAFPQVRGTQEVLDSWKTKAGLQAQILNNMALCGYVQLPKGHPCHGRDWDNLRDIHINGEPSFAGPGVDGTWVIGFDHGFHSDDLDEMREDCESLAKQLNEFVRQLS